MFQAPPILLMALQGRLAAAPELRFPRGQFQGKKRFDRAVAFCKQVVCGWAEVDFAPLFQ